MNAHDCSDLTPQQRTGLVVWHLAHGEGLDLAAVCALTGLTRRSACALIAHLKQCLAVRQDCHDVFYLAEFTPVAAPLCAQNRAAALVLALSRGAQLRGVDVARLLFIGTSAAYRLLSLLSLILPIAPDERRRWRACAFCEE